PMPMPLYRHTSREYPGFNMNIPDQFRADHFIHEIREKYEKGAEPFPQFLFIHLPNDHMADTRPRDGYPFHASYVADNDYALVERDGSFCDRRRRAGRQGSHRLASHSAACGWAIHQARLRLARACQLS